MAATRAKRFDAHRAGVLASLECAAGLGLDPGDDFWRRYFEASPEGRTRMAHMDAPMRGRMLASVLELLAIEDDDEVEAFLRFEIGNHDAYGARLPMYEALFEALHGALRAGCGEDWGPAWDEAWRERSRALLARIRRFTRYG